MRSPSSSSGQCARGESATDSRSGGQYRLPPHASPIERLNAHDLLGVLPHGAPEDEYDPEMEDFAALIAAGRTITPEVVASVWHKWFGSPSEAAAGPTPAMVALAADLQACSPSGA